MYDLERFVEAQEDEYDLALAEIRAGRKQSHWIWYIFPQLAELGFSHRAKFFGIENIDEARAYLDHPVLGPRYMTCVDALLAHQDVSAETLMNGEVDAKKLRSSLTLMAAAGGGDGVTRALDAFFAGRDCTATREALGRA